MAYPDLDSVINWTSVSINQFVNQYNISIGHIKYKNIDPYEKITPLRSPFSTNLSNFTNVSIVPFWVGFFLYTNGFLRRKSNTTLPINQLRDIWDTKVLQKS